MNYKTNFTFEEIDQLLEEIAVKFNLSKQTNQHFFILSKKSKDYSVEILLKNNKVSIKKKNNQDHKYFIQSFLKAFLPIFSIVVLIYILSNDVFFFIEKIIYSILCVVFAIFSPLLAKIVSLFFYSSTPIDSEINKIIKAIKQKSQK